MTLNNCQINNNRFLCYNDNDDDEEWTDYYTLIAPDLPSNPNEAIIFCAIGR
jgi:hypothetical protein